MKWNPAGVTHRLPTGRMAAGIGCGAARMMPGMPEAESLQMMPRMAAALSWRMACRSASVSGSRSNSASSWAWLLTG